MNIYFVVAHEGEGEGGLVEGDDTIKMGRLGCNGLQVIQPSSPNHPNKSIFPAQVGYLLIQCMTSFQFRYSADTLKEPFLSGR